MGWIIVVLALVSAWYLDFSPIDGKKTVYSRFCYEESAKKECKESSDFIYMKNTYRASFEGQHVINKFGSMPAEPLYHCVVLDEDTWSCEDRFMNNGELVYRVMIWEDKGLPIPEIIPKHQWLNESR